MKLNFKLFLTFLSAMMVFSGAFAQTSVNSDTISIKKGFETSLIYNGKALSMRQFSTMTSGMDDVQTYISRANLNRGFATGFALTSGFLIGWSIGGVIAGQEMNWGIAGAGAGAFLVALPFIAGYNSNAKRAAEIYNSKIGAKNGSSLKLGMTNNGFGLKLVF